jgi:hypothetical protein
VRAVQVDGPGALVHARVLGSAGRVDVGDLAEATLEQVRRRALFDEEGDGAAAGTVCGVPAVGLRGRLVGARGALVEALAARVGAQVVVVVSLRQPWVPEALVRRCVESLALA